MIQPATPFMVIYFSGKEGDLTMTHEIQQRKMLTKIDWTSNTRILTSQNGWKQMALNMFEQYSWFHVIKLVMN